MTGRLLRLTIVTLLGGCIALATSCPSATEGRFDGATPAPPPRLPELSGTQVRSLAEMAGDPSLTPWQREFLREFVLDAAPPSPPIDDPHEPPPRRTASVDDGTWTEVLPPVGRADHTAIYDPVRERMVVFGGVRFDSPVYMNDVWVLSLGPTPAWTQLNPSGTPPAARREHTAIYDPIGDRMVVFGGLAASAPNYRNDVWALSLGPSPAWTQLTPSGSLPPPRRNHAAVFDAVGQRMVIFGGSDGANRSDVWALSLGASLAWTELTPSGTPPTARAAHSAIYDPVGERMVVFGGTDGAYRNDVWELSLGSVPAWTALSPGGTPPSVRADHAAVYDPVGERMVVFGEWDGRIALLNEVWTLSLGTSPEWTQIPPSNTRAAGRWAHTAVYDPVLSRMVIFGGLPNYANDAWAFSLAGSAEWTELSPIVDAPAGRWFHAAVYDPVRDRIVVSGGYPNNIHDVWTLPLGGQPEWARLNPSGTPPTGRKNHSAIYDPVRDRMIVFAGFLTYPDDVGLVLYQNDVWTLSLGESPMWTQLFPAGTPPGIRDEHSAIYDPMRDRMVVFGGHHGYANYNDVWALSLGDAPAWTELSPTGTPPVARRRHNAIYDPLRDRMVVFGGYDTPDLSCVNDVWALSLGENPAWTQILPSGTPPSARGRQAAVHDALRDRLVVFGGYDCTSGFRNDVWALPLADNPAWIQLAPSGTLPTIRGGQSATYDPVRDRMVVVGGAGPYHLNDVWTLTWGGSVCAVPEIVSYDPALLTETNCGGGCTVDFVVDTQDDYSQATMVTLERHLEGMWIPEDSLLAPLPAPTWTLSCDFDEHFTDGEHVFHAVLHCSDGSRGVSQTVTVVADRGVPVAIGGFEAAYSDAGVALRWSVMNGASFRGFNVYRSIKAQSGFERINTALITSGRENAYTDRDVDPGITYWYRLGAVDDEGEWMSGTVSVTVPALAPELYQNVPNPFNPTTSISFFVPVPSRIALRVYDVEGRRVATLLDGVVDAGARTVNWDGRDDNGNRVGSGVYFYQLRATTALLTRKMVLLK